MKIIKLIFFVIFIFSKSSILPAEIIENQRKEKDFGKWKLICDIDLMMDLYECNIAYKFYHDKYAITYNPSKAINNKINIIISEIENNQFVKLRIDNNNLILSQNVNPKDFGIIKFSETDYNMILSQITKGKYLFIRFKNRSKSDELTARIDLSNLREAIKYYNMNFN